MIALHEKWHNPLIKAGETKPSTELTQITKENAENFMVLPFSENNPAFISSTVLTQERERIKQQVVPHIYFGIKKFIKEVGLEEGAIRTAEQKRAWLWAVKASKYNAIYFTARLEAQTDIDFVEKNADTIDAIGEFLDKHNGVTQIVNHALLSYAQTFDLTPGRSVQQAKKSVPRFGIQGYDQSTIVVGQAFHEPQLFETDEPLCDWHDLAHILAASSSDGIFGVKYQDGLDKLPRYYRALTEGEGMLDASGPLFSDGILFTQLSKPLFEYYEGMTLTDGSPQYSSNQIQSLVMRELFAYLAGTHELYHPGLGKPIKPERAIEPLELAVCVQNKRYERRAAEVERELFVRGTPEGKRGNIERDPLASLNRSERIKTIASLNKTSLYFEARNLIRHRAHEDALGQFAGYLLQEKKDQLQRLSLSKDRPKLIEDIHILQATVYFYLMEDVKAGQEINLYSLINEILLARKS